MIQLKEPTWYTVKHCIKYACLENVTEGNFVNYLIRKKLIHDKRIFMYDEYKNHNFKIYTVRFKDLDFQRIEVSEEFFKKMQKLYYEEIEAYHQEQYQEILREEKAKNDTSDYPKL